MAPSRYLLVAKRFAALFGLWLVLSGGRIEGLPFGLAAAFAGTVLSVRLSAPHLTRIRSLKLLLFVPGFLWRSLVGGVDVARRAFDPRLPLRPGWLDYPLSLPSGAARVALGGELSLMPGTLAAGTRGDLLLVHCLDMGQNVVEAIRVEERRLQEAVAR